MPPPTQSNEHHDKTINSAMHFIA